MLPLFLLYCFPSLILLAFWSDLGGCHYGGKDKDGDRVGPTLRPFWWGLYIPVMAGLATFGLWIWLIPALIALRVLYFRRNKTKDGEFNWKGRIFWKID